MWCLSLLHNFIHLSLNSGSAQVQILLAACRRFVMMKISGNGPAGNEANKPLSSVNHATKIIQHHQTPGHAPTLNTRNISETCLLLAIKNRNNANKVYIMPSLL